MEELDAIAVLLDAQDRRGYLFAKERRQVHRNALPIIRARALALKKELMKIERKAQNKKAIIKGWTKVVCTFQKKIKRIHNVRIDEEKCTSEDDKTEEDRSEEDKSEVYKSEEDKSEEDTFNPSMI